MRIKLSILFILISLSTQAAKHYVATGGGGAGTLVSPFANLTQVNAHTFVAGDSLLFNKGNSFFGTLTIDASGMAGSPIYIGSYGTGIMPIITGFQTLSSWTDNGDGKYYATVTGAEAQTNMVTVDGVNTAMGREPETGINRKYNDFSGTTSITDDSGIGDTPDWAGADIVINKSYFILERCLITDHAGDVFTFTAYNGNPYSILNNRYYFIQNDLRCLDQTNEWYHDYAANRLYIYGDPSAKEVKIATQKYVIDLLHNDYIIIDGLQVEGSIRALINIGDEVNKYGNNNNIEIKNCTLQFGGLEGITARMNNVPQAFCTIDNNIIRYCNADAIYAYGNGFLIENNNISYIGLIPGVALRGTDIGGIRTQSITTPSKIQSIFTIAYNNISYTGYNGVGLYGTSIDANVHHNYIYYSMQTTDDGGGVYSGGQSDYTRTVEHNIILNTGIGNTNTVISRGIYFDDGASNGIIRYNIVSHSMGSGILIHSSNNCTITHNTLYDNGYSAVQCGNLDFTKYINPITGTTVNNNKIIARTNTQRTLYTNQSTSEIQSLGTFDYNYYARPISDAASLYYSSGYKSLSAWQTLTGQDAHSSTSPTEIDNDNQLHFIYNATQESTYWDLSSPMIDVANVSYSGQVTLLPYTTMILIGNGIVARHTFSGVTSFAKDADGNFSKDTNGNFIKIIQ